jgi:hypothetical protein
MEQSLVTPVYMVTPVHVYMVTPVYMARNIGLDVGLVRQWA